MARRASSASVGMTQSLVSASIRVQKKHERCCNRPIVLTVARSTVRSAFHYKVPETGFFGHDRQTVFSRRDLNSEHHRPRTGTAAFEPNNTIINLKVRFSRTRALRRETQDASRPPSPRRGGAQFDAIYISG